MQTIPSIQHDLLDYQANKALLKQFRRLHTGEHLVGDQTCVLHASLGIDTKAPAFAPGGELVRVYVHTDNPQTFSLLSLAAYLGGDLPLIERAMKFVTILKHSQQPVEILALEPGHADGLNALTHDVPQIVENLIVKE